MGEGKEGGCCEKVLNAFMYGKRAAKQITISAGKSIDEFTELKSRGVCYP